MADEGFKHGLCLVFDGGEALEEGAGEVEGQVGAGYVAGGGAEVVEEAGQEICFCERRGRGGGKEGGGPGGGVGGQYGEAIDVDTHAV